MKYIFGPVNSRRFGLSLGVDLSPQKKSCNFDCLYCELDAAKPTDRIENPPKVEEIVAEVQEALEKYPQLEVITITANGEPTLYPHLDELVERLNAIKNGKKLLILSNASTITDPHIRHTLAKIDIVKLSLDCATPRCFKRLDRPLRGIDIAQIAAGMEEFRKRFDGLLVIEILVVAGLNDKPEEFEALNELLQRIKPDRVDIGTIDRPPAYQVAPVDASRLHALASSISDIPVSIVLRQRAEGKRLSYDEEQILDLLSHRPLSEDDLHTLFDSTTRERFARLLSKGLIEEIVVGNIKFFKKS